LTPTSLAFTAQALATTSPAKPVTLKNTGTATLTITSITITGTNAADFSQTHTCGASLAAAHLAAGASCMISMKFKPTATGIRTASLSVADNASASPQTCKLTGTGQ
jgi:trimeric autotransporter adhesin